MAALGGTNTSRHVKNGVHPHRQRAKSVSPTSAKERKKTVIKGGGGG